MPNLDDVCRHLLCHLPLIELRPSRFHREKFESRSSSPLSTRAPPPLTSAHVSFAGSRAWSIVTIFAGSTDYFEDVVLTIVDSQPATVLPSFPKL